MEREIVHVDIASFAVAVERVVHPELRHRPVAVAPLGRSRSVVTAVSPEAWRPGSEMAWWSRRPPVLPRSQGRAA